MIQNLNKSGIYKITNTINNKSYIGSAKNIRLRWKRHRHLIKHEKHHNKYLLSAIKKYKFENFTWEVIEFVEDFNNLIAREQYWLDFYKSYLREKGYNHSAVAASPLGVKHSAESRRNMSLAHVGNKHTQESKNKIAKSQEKEVYQIDKNGQIINKFQSLKEAENITGIERQSISGCCRKIIKFAKGYQWCFVKDFNEFICKKQKGSKTIIQLDNNSCLIKKWYSAKEVCQTLKISWKKLSKLLKENTNWKYE